MLINKLFKLCILLILSDLKKTQTIKITTKLNLFANLDKNLEVCKRSSKNLVDEERNIPHLGVVSKFIILEAPCLGKMLADGLYIFSITILDTWW